MLFLIFLLVFAAAVRQDFIFTVLYLFAGAYLIGNWWSRKSLDSVTYHRSFDNRVFLNEEIKVKLKVSNRSWLPVVWLRVNESLPVDLSMQKNFRQVFNIRGNASREFEYRLLARKRGYYRIGPLSAFSGDMLGLLGDQSCQAAASYLIVYPKIVPLTTLKLPSHSPMGTLRHTRPIFEDPTRVLSKRDYVAGDSLRRVDWKATAATGRMQVKQFEPSIALETSIFLNLNAQEYDLRTRFDSTELAIVIAASAANWVAAKKQSVGLVTNGHDPVITGSANQKPEGASYRSIQPIAPRKGQAHLIRILEVLARVQAINSIQMLDLLKREYYRLPWGTTIILISELIDDALFDQLFQIRRSGLNVMLILTGQGARFQEIRRKAGSFNFPLYQICNERDMDMWRR